MLAVLAVLLAVAPASTRTHAPTTGGVEWLSWYMYDKPYATGLPLNSSYTTLYMTESLPQARGEVGGTGGNTGGGEGTGGMESEREREAPGLTAAAARARVTAATVAAGPARVGTFCTCGMGCGDVGLWKCGVCAGQACIVLGLQVRARLMRHTRCKVWRGARTRTRACPDGRATTPAHVCTTSQPTN